MIWPFLFIESVSPMEWRKPGVKLISGVCWWAFRSSFDKPHPQTDRGPLYCTRVRLYPHWGNRPKRRPYCFSRYERAKRAWFECRKHLCTAMWFFLCALAACAGALSCCKLGCFLCGNQDPLASGEDRPFCLFWVS